MDKLATDAATAVRDIPTGASLAVGGFGLCGIPSTLITALADTDTGELEVASNNCGTDGYGLGILLERGRIRRVIASYIGENKEFARRYLAGELEVELNPQGTLAERLRAGGLGIPAFFTPAGVGTLVADGGVPWRYHPDGTVALASPAKEVRQFTIDGFTGDYVLEQGLNMDFALVRAACGDRHGNLVFHSSARNFNPLCAMAGRTAIAEVEELVEPGELDPDHIHLPGIFIHRIVALSPEQARDKTIEKLTLRKQAAR